MPQRTVEDFIRQAKMEDPRFPPLNLENGIRAAYDFAERVWRTPCHGQFVDHGVDHAFNDLRKARILLEEVLRPLPEHRLSNLERCVLTMAALFHDIGMQWNNFAPAAEKLSLSEVRARHIEKGQSMLIWGIRGGNPSVPTLAREVDFHDLFGHAGLVGFAHSGRLGWDALTAMRLAGDDWGPDGFPLRLKLLAAAFRLADEIDNSYNRITEYNRLCGETLDDETLAHWCACHFINDVQVRQEGWNIRIEVTPRYPVSDPASEPSIKTLLEEFRLHRMRQEEERVRPFLAVAGRVVPSVLVRLETAVRVEIPSLPVRVKEYLSARALVQGTAGVGDPPPPTTFNRLDSPVELRSVRDALGAADGAGRISKVGHFSLRSGYHCDRYFSLDHVLGASEQDDELVAGLRRRYGGEGFTLVLGVGTTGSMLAARLAVGLGLRFEYTASSEGYAGSGSRSSPTSYETAFNLRDAERVLIVEDLLGYGTSLAEIVYRLRQHATPPKAISAFCLVVTTDAPAMDPVLKDVSIDVLYVAGGVQYWKADTDDTCSVCRDGRLSALRDG